MCAVTVKMASHLIILCIVLLGEVWSQPYPATPVTLDKRWWKLSEDERVGSVVARAESPKPVAFALEPGFGAPQPLPFTIDRSGIITINQTLKGRAGEEFLIHVNGWDGTGPEFKVQVWVTVMNRTGNVREQPSASLEALLHRQAGSLPPEAGPPVPRRPPGLLPGVSRSPVRLSPVTPPQPQPQPQPPPTGGTPGSLPGPPDAPAAATHSPPSPPPPPTVASPDVADLALTIVPIVMICVIFALAGIGAFLFRRRICGTKNNPKKEDMKKNSNGLREDVVLQHWRGPRALGNRYEAWDSDLTNIPPQEAPPAPEKSVDRWEFPRHRLKVFNILGEGCFGQVWKCEALDIDEREGLTIVAVKTLKENAGERERSDLLQELQVMKMLEPHPNVVRLLGCCTEKDPLFVIMEYVPHGKLQSFLRNSRAQRCYDNMHGKSNTLTSRHLTSFCYQVAKGMQFLSSNGIIHRDLAARNILVGENYTCKVADFGFARDVIASHVYERKSEGRLPIRWMAPESLYDNVFSVKSDIWSYGVLIWEIVTLGSTPYPGLSAAEVMKKVKEGFRLDKPEHCKRELYNIMYYCWDREPQERPDFSEVVDLLEQLLLTETDYIELQHFHDHCYYNIVSLSGEKL